MLHLKAAVFELTGDENAAEIPIAVPVDEMTHAIIAQPQLLARIAERIGVRIIHQTDQEHTDWTPGDYTDQAYTLAWGERPRSRYWIPNDEVLRRLGILRSRYESIGLHDMGQRHTIVFGELAS